MCVVLPAVKYHKDTKRQTAQLDFRAQIPFVPRHRLPSLSVSLCVFCPGTSVEMRLLRKWLGWEQLLTVEITLARPPFTFLFTCLVLSHSAPLSEPVFLSRRTPAVSGWSETRCDQPNVILMYEQTLALSVFNLHNHFILLKQHRASFFLLLGHVVMKGECFGMSSPYPWRKPNSDD